ncbi:somatostatin receptor type 5 [Exaiptasia diaphana]|uniref:G-protein coupled receptors family 1 profile domain-containing protein n=1 Tax=Exaiptasia diaphana TaxID=2652724 RepID=A0A913XUS7_EXADI|nr:somatostatin receptor type 5 [Exaiptasia diaphana]
MAAAAAEALNVLEEDLEDFLQGIFEKDTDEEDKEESETTEEDVEDSEKINYTKMNESNTSLANVSNISTVNTYCKYDEPETHVEKIAKRTAYVLVVVLGISFNIFVIVLAAKFTVRKNLHHLIINMAVSDALYLFMDLLYLVPWLSDNKWSIYPSGTLGVIICKTTIFLLYISYRVSLVTLLVISIQRFRATAKTLKRSRPYTLKQRMAIIAVTWLMSMTAPIVYVYQQSPHGQICRVWYSDLLNNRVTSFVVLSEQAIMVILCCVIFILAILTIRRLTKPQGIQNHLSEEQRNVRARRTQSAVRMVLASVLLYACCWCPFLALSVVRFTDAVFPSADIINFSACIDWPSLYFIIYYFLPVVNSCFSPCIYLIFLSDFRDAVKKILCRQQTINQALNNPIELQPMNPVCNRRRGRRTSDEDHDI